MEVSEPNFRSQPNLKLEFYSYKNYIIFTVIIGVYLFILA
jgi:hypothetical protein